MKPALSKLLKDYAKYHRTRGNHLCHVLGIPMITLALLGASSQVEISRIDGGMLLWAFFSVWIALLDVKVGLLSSLVTLGLYFAGRQFSLPVDIGLFIAGWILQLVGHSKYEKNRPAFLTNFQHLLIGPVWVLLKCLNLEPPAQ